ncbi:MAG: pseudouridine synthase [Christensenellaceae bacterium]
MKTITATKTEKLQKLLAREYEGTLSSSRFFALLKNKDIKINGKRVGKNETVCAGDTVVVYYDGSAKEISLKVVFEDENVLICYKPKKITSEEFFASLKTKYDEIYFCHRLDRNTDGIMIFAKTEQAYGEIFQAFKDKKFEKYYIAEVYGSIKKRQDTLTHYILKDTENEGVKVFNEPVNGAKKAVLRYTVIKSNEQTTEVEILLLTGRTHQIRAQFAKIGHFVIGDNRYGNGNVNKLFDNYLHLTSYKLVLHFESGNKLKYLDNFECSLGQNVNI